MFIVDAHLDLAYNALRGREVLRAATEQRGEPDDIPTVGLPDLRQGHVGLICATVFVEPGLDGKPGYRSADEAHAEARRQLAWYAEQEKNGEMMLIRRREELPSPQAPAGRALPAILLLEGADALRNEKDVQQFFDAGMRIVGLAWKATRHAGGTGAPGPLTAEGVKMVRALDRVGVIHDASHLAEQSFWQLLDLTGGPMMASHSNCRAIVPGDRQISDEMIRAISSRGGVIGINFFDKFLLAPTEYGKRQATLEDVVRHTRHICELVGDAEHVAIGTDMDGGLGRDQIPQEITTSADLPRLADALHAADFNDNDVAGIMGRNWLRFFSQHLAS
ncbi:MAG TPA: membrane dipeptidase [Tepidisphaeraceae bacterium]|jgi:membrane dipeptidase